MDRVGRERGQADRDVVRAARLRRRVAHPLAGFHENGLARANVGLAAFVLDVEGAVDDDRVLVDLGTLAGLLPALGRLHPRDAEALVARVDAADELVDQLRLGAGGLHAARALDDLGHGSVWATG